MKILWIDSTASTNSYLREHGEEIGPMTMVCAREQTAGRGQRGNSWESEPGANLTFSFRMVPEGVRPACQFVVSEAVALAMRSALARFGIEAMVKWPNDIYVADSKICGILIENSIMGPRIASSIVGIGLNVNQTLFVSDAPNPVSMRMLTGREFPLQNVALAVGEELERYLSRLDAGIHEEYRRALWRGDGKEYPFRETASGLTFTASVSDVEPSGHIILGSSRYAFKEIEWLPLDRTMIWKKC